MALACAVSSWFGVPQAVSLVAAQGWAGLGWRRHSLEHRAPERHDHVTGSLHSRKVVARSLEPSDNMERPMQARDLTTPGGAGLRSRLHSSASNWVRDPAGLKIHNHTQIILGVPPPLVYGF